MQIRTIINKYFILQAHKEGRMHLHYGDLTDSTCLVKIISRVQPDEIYNLGAQSHVKVTILYTLFAACLLFNKYQTSEESLKVYCLVTKQLSYNIKQN